MEHRLLIVEDEKMQPEQTGKHYDQLAKWWQDQHSESDYGIAQLQRAIAFVKNRGTALDVGCGSSGRFIELFLHAGFQAEGLDVSENMLTLAQKRHPQCSFHHADITRWPFPKKYDLIAAWDSTFHLPLKQQKPALENMYSGLAADGVLIFTCGGTEEPGEISGTMQDLDFDYSALGIPQYLSLLNKFGCAIRHLEYDQGPDGRHVYIIAQKAEETPTFTTLS